MVFRVALKVLNEAEYIEHVLKMWYPVADEILVIHGCDSYMQRVTDRVTSDGLSGDGTTEIIDKFKDPQGKIEHVKMGFYEEEEESFERMMTGLKAGDIVWPAAGDTFFFRKDIRKCRKLMEETSCLTLRFRYRTYWHDFRHLLRGGGWDNELAVVFRLVEDDMEMVGKGVSLRDRNGYTYNDPRYSGTTVCPGDDTYLHHYSYVRTPEKILEKQCWQLEIEEGFSEATADSPIRRGTPSGGLDCWTIKQKFKTAEHFAARTFPWFTAEHDERQNIRVEGYDGPHPEALKGHPYHKLAWDGEPVLVKGITG